jgi:hypothetical protein
MCYLPGPVCQHTARIGLTRGRLHGDDCTDLRRRSRCRYGRAISGLKLSACTLRCREVRSAPTRRHLRLSRYCMVDAEPAAPRPADRPMSLAGKWENISLGHGEVVGASNTRLIPSCCHQAQVCANWTSRCLTEPDPSTEQCRCISEQAGKSNYPKVSKPI